MRRIARVSQPVIAVDGCAGSSQGRGKDRAGFPEAEDADSDHGCSRDFIVNTYSVPTCRVSIKSLLAKVQRPHLADLGNAAYSSICEDVRIDYGDN